MKYLISLFFLSMSIFAVAQPNNSVLQQARKQMMEGNYDAATNLYKQQLAANPTDIDAAKDYAYMLCLLKSFAEAENIIKPFILNDSYDVQAAQVAALSFKGQGRYDIAEQLYKKSLIKFPTSGVLYNETGELYAIINNLNAAITYWEKGINIDSNFGTNYYNAAMYYSKMQQQPLRVVLYGEIFANIESFSNKTANIKEVLFNTYKSLLNNKKLDSAVNSASTVIEKNIGLLLAKNLDAVKIGITTETLTAIRTRVVLDWFNNNFGSYKLIIQQQFLLRQNLFTAYNMWLFEAYANPLAFANFKQVFSDSYQAFEAFQKSRIFKISQ
jgi:tetratricopeptide (TPR) repeat protein